METTIFLAIIRFIIEWTCVHPKSMELDFNSCSFNYKYDYTSRSSVGEPGIMIRVLKCSISNCNRVCIKMKHLKVVRQWCKKIEIGIFDKWLIPLIVSHISYWTNMHCIAMELTQCLTQMHNAFIVCSIIIDCILS